MEYQNIATICGDILDYIENDTDVSDWVTANFSTTIGLYLGLDLNELPDEAGTPWCAAIPTAFGKSDEYNHREAQITMTASIKKATTTDTGKYTNFDGIALIVEIAELLQTSTGNALDQNILGLSDISIGIEYPYFRASWTFRVPTSNE